MCVSGRARSASGSGCESSDVMNESGCVQTCTVKLVELRIKYPACEESVAASFRT